MSYCGQQYTGKKCECQLQVTAGTTVATKEASNPQRICAFREDGIQYPCDSGCCPEECSVPEKQTPTETTSTDSKASFIESPWFVILASLIYSFMWIAIIIYRQIVDAR